MKVSKTKTQNKINKGITLNKNPLLSSISSSKISSDISTVSLHNLLSENISLINLKDSQNKTFLSYAIERNNSSIINLIIDSPLLDLTYKNKDGNTYIHLSVIYNNISLTKSLIKKGINLNVKNNKGNTCLHLAYLYNNNEIIRLLIENGADQNIKNYDNKTPEEMLNNNYLNCNEVENSNNNIENSESYSSTQLDWVRRAIDNKIKNIEIFNIKSDTENISDENKTKINKSGKFNYLYNKEKDDNSEEQIFYDIDYNSKLRSNNIIESLENNVNKENGYMMKSTKDSEKNEKIKYKNDEMTYSENNKNINYTNSKEDIINIKTLSFLNIKPEFDNMNQTNFILNNENIYKRIINNGYVFPKNKLKKSITKLDTNNFDSNYSSNRTEFHTNEKAIKYYGIYKNTSPNNLGCKDYSKKKSENNICVMREFINKEEIGNYKKINTDSSSNNNNINNINSKNKIISYLNLKKNYFTINNSDDSSWGNSNKKIELKSPSCINKDKANGILNIKLSFNNNNNNSRTHSYNDVNENDNISNKNLSIFNSSKFKKKNISHKFILSTNNNLGNQANILLRNFLSQINMQNYYMNLKLNGFDNINLLIEQMKSESPIKDSELKKAGIIIPGDRAKILIRLEEKGNIFPFDVPKNVYYCLNENIDISEDENINKLKNWLEKFNMENYLNNFIMNGYYTVELFIFQMFSKNPIDNGILEFDIGIDKIGHRSRILSILKKESKIFGEKIKHYEESLDIKDDVKNCGCLIA